MKREYGVQMYSVRDIAEKDFNAAIQAVAKLGYKKLEFAGFFDKTADEVCRYMEDAGVVCGGTHSNWKLLFPETIDETIAYMKAIGNRRFIIPGATLNTLEQIDDFVSVVNAAEKKLSAAGIDLAYHNHSKEFVTMYWGNTIHNELAQRTDMKFEIDTYWAFNAGVDPVVLCERLKDRIPVIHLKDGFFGGTRWCGGAQVRYIVYQGGVSLVPDSGNNRNIRMIDGSDNGFFVKTPKVL